MRGFHKTKRVTWASDVSLCQVKLFLSEEAPFQVRLGVQDHLQAKASGSSSHLSGPGSDDGLPPGFEAPQISYHHQIKLSEIPLICWRCPRRFVLDDDWRVVAGEESREVEAENQREMRVLEAVYPRESSIPQNPAYPLESIEFHRPNQQIPSIPITAIEDEELPADQSSSYGGPMNSQPPLMVTGISGSSRFPDVISGPEMPRGLEPEVASAAISAIMQSNEHGSSIDRDLLIQILSDPKMIEKLVTDYGTSTSGMNGRIPPDPVTPSIALPTPQPVSGPVSSSGPFYTLANGPNPRFPQPTFTPAPQPTVRPYPPPPRDMSYYKNLIQQHGAGRERPESVIQQYSNNRPDPASSNNPYNGMRPKGKIMKPCLYFNSSRGCKNGSNCAYQHDSSAQQPMGDVQNSKRMKLDREITGT